MTSLRNIIYDNLDAYRYSNMETMFNPREMGNEDWRDFYNELLYIQGFRGLIKSKQLWDDYINRNDVVVKKNDTCECVICLDLFNKSIASLSCGHLFHFECICRWYITNNYTKLCKEPDIFCKEIPTIRCPICRSDAVINRIYNEYPEYIYVISDIDKKDKCPNNIKNELDKDSNLSEFKISENDKNFKKKLEERLEYMIYGFSRYNKEYQRRLTAYETYIVASEIEYYNNLDRTQQRNQRRRQMRNHPYYEYSSRGRSSNNRRSISSNNRRSISCTIC